MQPMKLLSRWLYDHANDQHHLFCVQDLRPLFPHLSPGALKTLLSRTVQAGILEKVCRGLFLYRRAMPAHGLLLFHAAAYLRSNHFNYISLETALSDSGVISQIPINWISLMSSGRSSQISCGHWGTIEFVHTCQKPTDIAEDLVYDKQCHLWRASVGLALRDMKATRRNQDLIDWDIAHEFI